MTRIFRLLFFIGFIGHEARGNNNDPAPGRSPGPPVSQTELYLTETSHESYRPREASTDAQEPLHNADIEAMIMNNRNRFSDLISSMSRENVDYRDSQDFAAATDDDRQKLIIDKSAEMNARLQDYNNISRHSESDDETALNALKNSTSSGVTVNSISDGDSGEKSAKMIKSECGHSVKSGKIFNYLRLGDKIVKMDVNDSENEYYDTRIPSDVGKLQIYVTHDVFSTETSLLAGIIYKGKVITIIL